MKSCRGTSIQGLETSYLKGSNEDFGSVGRKSSGGSKSQDGRARKQKQQLWSVTILSRPEERWSGFHSDEQEPLYMHAITSVLLE